MIVGGREVVGVPKEHKICLIIDIGGGDFLVLHRENTNNSSLEIKTGSLGALHNGIAVRDQSIFSHGRIIMTNKGKKRYGAINIPLPLNYEEINLGMATKPIYGEEDGPTFMERPVKILYYSQL